MTGLIGETGSQGLTGLIGATGSQGVTGLRGLTGLTGETGYYTIEKSVNPPADPQDMDTYWDTDEEALFVWVADSSAWVQISSASLEGPSGVTGLQGIQGETGLRGLTGPEGGPQGVTGLIGSTGSQGLTGLRGLTGAQGVTGIGTITQGATGVIDNSIVRWDGTNGQVIQWSSIVLDDLGRMSNIHNSTFDAEYNNGNSSTSITINWNNGQKQWVTMTNNCTFTFTAPAGPGNFILRVVQDGTGGRVATWPSSVYAPGGKITGLVLSTAANTTDIISLYYNGANYYATIIRNFAV